MCLGYSQKKDLNSPKGTTLARANPILAPARDPYWDPSIPPPRYACYVSAPKSSWIQPSHYILVNWLLMSLYFANTTTHRSTRGPSFDDINGLPISIHDRHNPHHDQRSQWGSPYSISRPAPPPPTFANINTRQPSYPTGGQAPMLAAHQATTHAYRDAFPPQPSSADSRPHPQFGIKDNIYKPREEEHVQDRNECRSACTKFNTAVFEGSGEGEIRRRLEAIVKPLPPSASPDSGLKNGTLGKGVVIDAPFRADYGWNLHIGDSVIIDSGCTIKDPAMVFIGPYVRIGSNVTISGEYVMHDSKYSDQSKKVVVRIGKKTTIGSGCVIAAQDTLELCIGDNVYIAPGSVISHVSLKHFQADHLAAVGFSLLPFELSLLPLDSHANITQNVASNSVIGPVPPPVPPYDERHMRPTS